MYVCISSMIFPTQYHPPDSYGSIHLISHHLHIAISQHSALGCCCWTSRRAADISGAAERWRNTLTNSLSEACGAEQISQRDRPPSGRRLPAGRGPVGKTHTLLT